MLLRDPQNVIWNLFLAIIPVALGFVIAAGMRRQKRSGGAISWLFWLALLLIWLVFLPNTCYLLTEWRHYLATIVTSPVYLEAQTSRPIFIDFLLMTGFYLLYTGCGLLTFFLAVWPLDRLARRRLRNWVWPLQALIFALCALGVYLGLIDRFNSWDLAHPARLYAILETSLRVQQRPLLFGFILGFGAILWLLYTFFDIWMDGAAWRLRARRDRGQPPPAVFEEESWRRAAS
jgi:uncharacterized membrane protein